MFWRKVRMPWKASSVMEYRPRLSLEKDAPFSRAVDRAGHILCRPILGGLHHQYARINLRQALALAHVD